MAKKTVKTIVPTTQPAEVQPSTGGRFIRQKDGSLIKAEELKTTDFNDQQLDKPADTETQTLINQEGNNHG